MAKGALALCVLTVALVGAGCQTIGPTSIPRDRLDYAGAIAGSWREQALLNIVKLRYFDQPVFLEIASVISSYSLQSEVSVSAQAYPFSTSSGANNTNRRLGVSGMYTDRPTISYTPVTGEKYIDKLLRPIPPQAIFAMLQAGHPADYILSLTVRAINDFYNSSAGPARQRHEDHEFRQIVDAFRRIQQAGALGVRIEKRAKEERAFIFFRHKVEPEVERDILFIRNTLNVKSEVDEIPLSFGLTRPGGGELTLLTRSMWEVLAELSAGVEVPLTDIAEGRATPAPRVRDGASPITRIHADSERPANAHVAVRYRDYWFWIDDRDLQSKRLLTFLNVFFSIAETGAVPQVPLITIPAN